tara:strand:+ start:381 stop:974 length:594 start_codon:yes stop_codon:yes gene_type:complete
MHKTFHKLEHLIDRIIPYAVLLLLVIIITTFFFKQTAEHYHTQIEYLDYTIIAIFIIDLSFKFIRVRKIKPFVKTYWIDILAIFPFYLFLRAIEEIILLSRLAEITEEGQSIFHAGKEAKSLTKIEKETSLLINEAEKASKISRSRFATRFLRPIARVPRLMKILPYYEKTTGTHHPHDKIKIKTKQTKNKVKKKNK